MSNSKKTLGLVSSFVPCAVGFAALVAACSGASDSDLFGAPGASSSGGSSSGASSGGSSSGGSSSGGSSSGGSSSGGSSSSSGGACVPKAPVALDNTPVTFEIVYDASGSMSDAAQEPKWGSVTVASNEWFTSLLTKNDTRASVGVIVFGDSLDPTNSSGPYPAAPDVAPAVVDAAQLTKLKGRMVGTAQGLTPTYAALSGAYGVLEALPAATRGRRAVLYVSDGDLSESRPLSDYTALVGGKLAGPRAILTYAIGIGDVSVSFTVPQNLAELALAGGTARPSCDKAEKTNLAKMCHQQVNSKNKTIAQAASDVGAALVKMRYHAVACDIDVTPAIKADPKNVNVSLVDASNKRQEVPAGTKDGWVYDDPTSPTRIVLQGEACVTARSALYRAEASLGCPSK